MERGTFPVPIIAPHFCAGQASGKTRPSDASGRIEHRGHGNMPRLTALGNLASGRHRANSHASTPEWLYVKMLHMQAHRQDAIDLVRSQWAAQRPELDTSPMEIIGRILRIERVADARMRPGFRDHGLDRGGFDVLATLRRSDPPYQLTPTQLYEALVLTSGAMTHRVDTLLRAGLVERIPGAKDRRSQPVGLTAKGRSVIDRAMDAHLAAETRLVAHLRPAQQLALAASLKKLLQGMEERPWK